MGGGRGRSSRQQRGDDLRFDLTIDFEDAIFGTETEVKLRRLEVCSTCDGRGSASGRGPSICSHCEGRGQIRYQQGFFSVARTCAACSGTGQVITDPCPTCRGEGRAAAEVKLNVKVPAGRGRGHAHPLRRGGRCRPRGGPKGDLYIVLSIRPHDFFERHGLRPALRDPHQLSAGCAGRRVRNRGRRWPDDHEDSRRHAKRRELRIRGRGVPHLNAKGQGDLW